MDSPKPERQNTRVIAIFVRFLSLPYLFVSWLCGRWTSLCFWCKSKKTNREEDQLRQSRIRRELRGLPADHVQTTAAPAKPEIRPE
jgi:hypothetical protein